MDGRRPEANQHVSLDINTAWLESVDDRARTYLNKKNPARPTIFRVPPCLRQGNTRAYDPRLVSIGPYHRGKSTDLNATEELKWRLLHNYLSKIPDGSKNECLRKMKDLEKRARECYSEVVDYLNSDQFVEMMLLDGCFLVQIIIIPASDYRDPETEELYSLIDDNLWFATMIFRDLLLLENQLPYFIVEHLLDTLKMPGWNRHGFQRAVVSSFAEFLPNCPDDPQPKLPAQGFEHMDHLLHLFHLWILSIPKSQEVLQRRSSSSRSNKFLKIVPCMTELVEAGVEIKEKETKNFLDISFCNGVLKIPSIVVDEDSNFVLANLTALEQCCCRHEPYVTLYIMFLDQIINTPRDVELLHQEGIIHRDLGTDKVIASLFNKLGENLRFTHHGYLNDVYKGLNDYCGMRWPRWRAKAVREYFGSPWAMISLGAAIVLLGLTTLQSLYSILAYYKK